PEPQLERTLERLTHRRAAGEVLQVRLGVAQLAYAAVEAAARQRALATYAPLLGARVAVVAVRRRDALAAAARRAAVAVRRVAVVALLAGIEVAVAAERAEGGHRVGRLPGNVDVGAVGAHGESRGAGEPVDVAHRVVLRVDEDEAAGRGVAIEHRQGVRVRRGGVDVRAVRAHGHRVDAVEAVDAVDRLAVDLDEGERAARRVAGEDRERVIELAGRVEVRAVG